MSSFFSQIGRGLKQEGERMRQKGLMPIGKDPKNFRPTSNARVTRTLTEASNFSRVVQHMVANFSSWQRFTDASLSSMRAGLTSRLPCTIDDVNGQLMTKEPMDRTVGQGMDSEGIARGANHLRQHFSTDVIVPLQQWVAAYKAIKKQNEHLEDLRLNVDSKKRDLGHVQDKLEGLLPDSKEYPGLQKEEAELTQKLTVREQEYRRREAEIFSALEFLNKDTVVLKNYIKAALAIMQESITVAHATFEGQPPAAPVQPAPAPGAPAPEGTPVAPAWYTHARTNYEQTHAELGANSGDEEEARRSK